MKSFSVLTVSKRTGWEKMARASIKKQIVKPNKWIVVSELAERLTAFDGLIKIQAPETTRLSNLNASLNMGLHFIDTQYVIFYQDFIELPEDCFEKLLALATPNTFVTTCTPNYDGSDDGRYTGADCPRSCMPEEWETNVALCPMRIIRDLGGFDEEYDWGWSWDNVNIAQRAAMLGAKFILDESNRPRLYPHEMSSHETLPLNAERHGRTMMDIRTGKRPIKNTYL